MFAAGAGLALLDAYLRRDPPAAGALRARLALKSAAASATILRLNTDEGALRDLRFAVGDARPGREAPSAVARPRRPAAQPRRRPARRRGGRARSCRGQRERPRGKPARTEPGQGIRSRRPPRPLPWRSRPSRTPPRPEAEILALWAFDLVLALRLRWARPVPLIATKILDPSLRSDGRGRPKPGDPAWANIAAGAIALAAASALDLAADLSRRAETLLAVAPKLRAKPAEKIVDLLLAQDCVAPAEAARHAPMTDRAARRLFDRLVALGAARELSGRPAFRLYGL